MIAQVDLKEINRVLETADQLYSPEQVLAAEEKMAAAISGRLADKNPLLLCVMNGGLQLCGNLANRLRFPLQIDYLHATRYRGDTVGGGMHWIKHPEAALNGRCILIVDDILDEGHTLKAIVDHCWSEGADEVLCAVLVQKNHDRKANVEADFVGLTVPDRYVFGCGMDYKTYWRNLPAIYAVGQDLD